MLLSRRDALHGLVVVGELRRRAQRDACGGGAEVCEILAEDAARVGSLSLVPDEDALQLQVRCRSGVLVFAVLAVYGRGRRGGRGGYGRGRRGGRGGSLRRVLGPLIRTGIGQARGRYADDLTARQHSPPGQDTHNLQRRKRRQ